MSELLHRYIPRNRKRVSDTIPGVGVGEDIADDDNPVRQNGVERLRQLCLASSTRPFKARGIALRRCQHCLLAESACICRWRQQRSLDLDFVLIMHRDEVYKPTNTGRLIADVFPGHCRAFLWSRTQPDPALVALLNDPQRDCWLVFPGDRREHDEIAPDRSKTRCKRLTLILLDGTWKQASKMASKAVWLRDLPRIDALPSTENLMQGNYALRASHCGQRLSTAEAASFILSALNRPAAAEILLDYFSVFNEHYLSSRRNCQPRHLAAHDRLEGGLV